MATLLPADLDLTARRIVGYDVIGDVHGHHDALVRLLEVLGYRDAAGSYRHPERCAVFVGDLIDRGPGQLEAVALVRAMVAGGHARIVMGNHEFNAIAYATPDPHNPGEHLRRHDDKHRSQHREFLDQVGHRSALHDELIAWFNTIPMWCELELGESRLRVVHACWHQPSLQLLEPLLGPDRTLTPEVLVAGSRRGGEVYDAIETVLKGPEVDMGGAVYLDEGGHERSSARLQWWQTTAGSLRDLALLADGVTDRAGKPFPPLPDTAIDTTGLIYADEVPVLFGHYWQTGTPAVYSATTASVDFSVAAKGRLVAYRWNGERALHNNAFVSVGWQADSH